MPSSTYCLPKVPGFISNLTANSTAKAADDALSVYEVVFYALLATAASAVTAFGNLLVLVSFRIDRQLQTVSNYYLMSLAVADLLIGFVSMPIYTIYLLVTYWPFDIIVCNLYLCFDYTMCNASVASLLIISIDRYRSVTSPLVYRGQRTPKRALIMIACAWVVSIVLWSPLIVLSSVTKEEKVATVCQVEFINDNPYLTFFTSIMAFFLPVTVMTILYVRIFRETKKRQRELQNLQAGCGGGGGSSGSAVAAPSSANEIRKRPQNKRRRCDASATSGSLLRRCVRGLIDSDEDGGSGDNNEGDSGGGGGGGGDGAADEDTDCWETLREDRPVSTQHFPKSNSYFRVNYQAGRRGQPAESSLTSLPGNATYPDLDDRIEELEEQQECLTYVVWIRLPDTSGQTRIQLRSKRARTSSSENQLSTRCPIGPATTRDQPLQQPQQEQQVAIVVANASASTSDGNVDGAVSRFDSAKSNATADSGIDSIGGGGGGNGRARVGSPPKQSAPTSRRPSQAPQQQQQQQHKQQQQRQNAAKTSNNSNSSNSSKKETKNEQKAAKTLSAILLVFIVTWIPYNVFTLIRAVYRANCPDEHFRPLIPDTLYNFGYWLCYLNSTMNPVCYALCNANFRRTFWKILTCKSRKRRTLRQLGQGLYSHTRVVHAVAPTGARQQR